MNSSILLMHAKLELMAHESEKLKIELLKIKEEKDKYESLYHNSPNGYFTFDQNGYIIDVNQAGSLMLCYPKEALINKIFHVYIVKEYWEVFNLFFKDVFVKENKQSCELKLLDKDGQTFWVQLESIMVLNSSSGVLQCRTSVFDISKRKETERILAIKESQLKSAQKISNLGNWTWDIKTNKISWSDQLYDIFDLKTQEFEITARYFFSRVSTTTKREIISLMDLSISQKKTMEVDFIILNSINKDKIVTFKCMPEYDYKGDLVNFHGTIQDITERKKQRLLLEEKALEMSYLYDQIKHSEEKLKKLNDNKDKFFTIIAHNLKNPFSILLSLTDLLSNDFENMEKASLKTIATKINDSSNRIYALLDNLLKWSKLQFSNTECIPEIFDVSSVTESSLKLLEDQANKKNIMVKTKFNKKALVYTDKNIFDAVMQNLFINAVKFSHNGGVIKIESENIDDFIQISISDNGIGMSNKAAKNLFKLEKIESTLGTENEKGTGLGLLICKDLIERQGGKINVESNSGKGSKFMFTVPIYKENIINNRKNDFI